MSRSSARKRSLGVAVAPVVVKLDTRTPEEKRAANREYAFRVVTDAIEMARDNIADFALIVEKHGATYAMTWRGETAMLAEKTGYEAWRLFSFLINSVKTDEEKLVHLREEQARIVRDFLGDSHWSPGPRGPWSNNSTCAISNLAALAECNSKREMHSLLSNVVRLLSTPEGAV
jgi:hypothetical protein